MSKNILKENMKRFNTKNLNEQTPAPGIPAAQQKTTAEYERKQQLINNRKKVTPEQLMKYIPVGQTALIMTADETPGYLLVVDKKDNYYELI